MYLLNTSVTIAKHSDIYGITRTFAEEKFGKGEVEKVEDSVSNMFDYVEETVEEIMSASNFTEGVDAARDMMMKGGRRHLTAAQARISEIRRRLLVQRKLTCPILSIVSDDLVASANLLVRHFSFNVPRAVCQLGNNGATASEVQLCPAPSWRQP
jgi:hypothetical protein